MSTVHSLPKTSLPPVSPPSSSDGVFFPVLPVGRTERFVDPAGGENAEERRKTVPSSRGCLGRRRTRSRNVYEQFEHLIISLKKKSCISNGITVREINSYRWNWREKDSRNNRLRWPDYVKPQSLVIPRVFNISRKILVTF